MLLHSSVKGGCHIVLRNGVLRICTTSVISFLLGDLCHSDIGSLLSKAHTKARGAAWRTLSASPQVRRDKIHEARALESRRAPFVEAPNFMAQKGTEVMETVARESQESITWKDLEHHQSEIQTLEEKVMQVKASIHCSENDTKKELEFLWRRVKTAATLLTYLKSKARLIAVPHLAYTSCGIKHQEGIGLIDKYGIPLADWSNDVDLSSHESSDEETLLANSTNLGSLDASDGAYIGEILKSVHMVSDVMESLVKRVIMAETEAASEKEKVYLGLEEITRRTLQIESMSAKVVEMEKFALGTNGILNEMRQKVEEMVEETSRQRQRATENEEELCRVKQDFESLRSYVSSLISVRETLLSSEKQFQTMEKLFDRLMAKTSHLEAEKAKKEAEVQKLMEENVTLRAMLDDKEAQLLAMNEQCKYMALHDFGV